MKTHAAHAPGDTPRLLIVDDNFHDRLLLRAWLKEFAHTRYCVQEVHCLKEADALLGDTTFDCILLDGFLQDGVCFDYLPRWSERLPVIVISSDNSRKFQDSVISYGARRCLDKNKLSGKRLVKEIGEALGGGV